MLSEESRPYGRRPNGLAMCSSGPQGQTEALQALKGRANSELRNVAPQGEAAAEAPKKIAAE